MTNGSQFYINQVNNNYLDGSYTVFGEVVKGLDVVDSIQQAACDRNDRPLEDIRILKTKIIKR